MMKKENYGHKLNMKLLGVENNWGIGIVGNTWPLHGRVSGSSPLSSTKINLWERSVTRASVELYDMGERNGGRPAGEGAKTP